MRELGSPRKGLGNTYGNVDQGNAGAKVGVWIDVVDKSMLPPVAHHEADAQLQQGQQEDEQGGLPGDIGPEQVDGRVIETLAEGRLDGEIDLALAEEVQRQLQPDEEVEAADVAEKVAQLVALVADGGRQVVGPVAFDVMMLDMMIVVGVPGVAHQRIGEVGEQLVEPGQGRGALQDAAHVDVLVHHQRVGADVVRLHDPMQDSVDPAKMPEQHDGAGHGGGEVQQQMGQHHDVGFHAHKAPRRADVRLQDPSMQPSRQV